MKQISLVAYAFFIFFIMFNYAHSHVGELEAIAISVEQQVKSLNSQNAWKSYSPKNKLGIEFFYDSKNIQSPYTGVIIATTKTKYNDSSFLDKLKKSRSLQHQVMGAESSKLNYKDIAYTIQTLQINCTQKEFMKKEIIADFDNNHNLLNLLPSVRRQFSPIRANTSYEKLFNILCK